MKQKRNTGEDSLQQYLRFRGVSQGCPEIAETPAGYVSADLEPSAEEWIAADERPRESPEDKGFVWAGADAPARELKEQKIGYLAAVIALFWFCRYWPWIVYPGYVVAFAYVISGFHYKALRVLVALLLVGMIILHVFGIASEPAP
jgi:hypothetical protein